MQYSEFDWAAGAWGIIRVDNLSCERLPGEACQCEVQSGLDGV